MKQGIFLPLAVIMLLWSSLGGAMEKKYRYQPRLLKPWRFQEKTVRQKFRKRSSKKRVILCARGRQKKEFIWGKTRT